MIIDIFHPYRILNWMLAQLILFAWIFKVNWVAFDTDFFFWLLINIFPFKTLNKNAEYIYIDVNINNKYKLLVWARYTEQFCRLHFGLLHKIINYSQFTYLIEIFIWKSIFEIFRYSCFTLFVSSNVITFVYCMCP